MPWEQGTGTVFPAHKNSARARDWKNKRNKRKEGGRKYVWKEEERKDRGGRRNKKPPSTHPPTSLRGVRARVLKNKAVKEGFLEEETLGRKD